MSGFGISIDGSPYVFFSQGVGAATSTDADWSADWIQVQGALAVDAWSWSERVKPIDTDLDIDGLTFKLHDLMMALGPAQGFRLATWLCSRKISGLGSAEITATIIHATADVTVSDGTPFGSSGGVVWIEQEAILCDARTGGTLPIITRAYYGTAERDHAIDTANSFRPTAFASFPGVLNRRVVFWRISDAGIATPWWRGYCRRAPRFSGGNAGVMELQCDHAWAVERELPLGIPTAVTALRGFDTAGIDLFVANPTGNHRIHSYETVQNTYPDRRDRVYGTLRDALQESANLYQTALEAGWAASYVVTDVDTLQDAAVWRPLSQLNTLLAVDSELEGTFGVGSQVVSFSGLAGGNSNGNPRTAEVLCPSTQSALMAAIYDGLTYGPSSTIAAQWYPVSTLSTLPASWATVPHDAPGYSTTVTPVLRGEDGNAEVILSVDGVTSPDTQNSGPFILGWLRSTKTISSRGGWSNRRTFFDIAASAQNVTPIQRMPWVESAATLRLATVVESGHFYYAIQYGVFDETYTKTPADKRNWDFATASRASVIDETSATGALIGRKLLLDGGLTLGKVVLDGLIANGCGLGSYRSRLRIFRFGIPLPSDAIVATLTDLDIEAGQMPAWTTLPEGLCNIVEATLPSYTLLVRDQESVSRYGLGRTAKVDLQDVPGSGLSGDPNAISRYLLSRVLGLWSRPTYMVTLPLGLSAIETIFLGDYVSVASAILPDGVGARGMTASTGQVIGKNVSLQDGLCTIDVVLQDAGNVCGYAPCVRISDITTNVLTVIDIASGPAFPLIPPSYLPETTGDPEDASGSDNLLGTYRGIDGDGGTFWFSTGDKVRLIVRDSTTWTVWSGTIQSINYGASPPTITLTASPPGSFQTVIAGGGWVDLIYDQWDVVTTSQKRFGFVAAFGDPALINSVDPARVWST